ncbi:hypothetical protein F4804DRAFT_347990 [Jackrogersella minutella]|nr:hypothetical protein F4804DRAFT_347990 [Jackrogersella minutella]
MSSSSSDAEKESTNEETKKEEVEEEEVKEEAKEEVKEEVKDETKKDDGDKTSDSSDEDELPPPDTSDEGYNEYMSPDEDGESHGEIVKCKECNCWHDDRGHKCDPENKDKYA